MSDAILRAQTDPSSYIERVATFHNQIAMRRDKTTRDNNIRRIWYETASFLEQQTGISPNSDNFDPTWVFAMIADSYAPTTAHTYCFLIPHIIPNFYPKWQLQINRFLKELQLFANTMEREEKATPATSEQVKNLVRQAQLPEERLILAMWVTASRHSDMDRFQVAWYPHGIRLKTIFSKADSQGEFQRCKWVPATADSRADTNFWLDATSTSSYDNTLKFVKSREPTLSLHSFRSGAVQFLQTVHGFTEIQTSKLTLHSPAIADAVSGLKAYKVDTFDENAQLSVRMASLLKSAAGL